MYIQYAGFIAAATARIYAFRVADALQKAREFTVRVRLAAFRPAALKFQEGPQICLARLERELEGETPESSANAHLCVEEQDIQEYVQQRHPRKRSLMGKLRPKHFEPTTLSAVLLAQGD